MRTIEKRTPPPELTAWQVAYRNTDPNYGYDLMRQDRTVTVAVLNSLVEEQGYLCAYTGVRIYSDVCHIEHVRPQSHCKTGSVWEGQDVAYKNMVACYPDSKATRAAFGAHPKENWPSPSEWPLFVSPLERGCEERFVFDKAGRMKPADPGDAAAAETIKRLRLNDESKAPQLILLRREAIRATLKKDSLRLDLAKIRLRTLEQQEESGGQLEPFCFALKQALRKHIARVEGIRDRKIAAAKKAKTH